MIEEHCCNASSHDTVAVSHEGSVDSLKSMTERLKCETWCTVNNHLPLCILSLSQVCNETDAQLIIFKYKKNTIKREEEKKSFIQKWENNVL